MIEFITGPAGSGKTTCMFARIKERCQEADKLCIIVPEQFSQDFDKKLYFYLGAENFNELFSLSFTGLARQLFQLYGDPARKGGYADDMAKMILVYQAVESAMSRPDSVGSFIYLVEGHIIPSRNVNQYSHRSLHGYIIQQWIGYSSFRGFNGPSVALSLTGSHHSLTHLTHNSLNIGKIQIN